MATREDIARAVQLMQGELNALEAKAQSDPELAKAFEVIATAQHRDNNPHAHRYHAHLNYLTQDTDLIRCVECEILTPLAEARPIARRDDATHLPVRCWLCRECGRED